MITNVNASMLAAAAAVLSIAAMPAYARGPAPDPAVKDFQRVVDAAYAKYKDLKDGKNADYIPILTETPSDLFGVVIVTKDGKVYSAGDVDYQFSIQSVSKPFTAALVMTQQSPASARARRSASSRPACRSTRRWRSRSTRRVRSTRWSTRAPSPP